MCKKQASMECRVGDDLQNVSDWSPKSGKVGDREEERARLGTRYFSLRE
jgi:hypothetical protein